MKIRIYRNQTNKETGYKPPRWKKGHLPIHQTLIWVGPFFLLIQQPKRRKPERKQTFGTSERLP